MSACSRAAAVVRCIPRCLATCSTSRAAAAAGVRVNTAGQQRSACGSADRNTRRWSFWCRQRSDLGGAPAVDVARRPMQLAGYQHRPYSSAAAGGDEVPVVSPEAQRLLYNLIAQHDALVSVRDSPDAMTDMNHRQLTKMTQELATLAPVVGIVFSKIFLSPFSPSLLLPSPICAF